MKRKQVNKQTEKPHMVRKLKFSFNPVTKGDNVKQQAFLKITMTVTEVSARGTHRNHGKAHSIDHFHQQA